MKQAKWKQQYRDKENTTRDWKGSFSNFKFRIAMPATDGSSRLWKQNMEMYETVALSRSKVGTRTLLPQSLSKTNQIKGNEVKKFNRYSEKYSFFSTVAGTTTTNFKEEKVKPLEKVEQTLPPKRPLTGHSIKKHAVMSQQPEKTHRTGQHLYHRIQSAVDRSPQWVIKRPISGKKQTVEILTSMQFERNRERIENIKNKITSETQYSTPISRIGYNMQHQALFKYEHLELLSKGSQKKKFLPIQYAIKDLNIKTHHVYDSEKYHPISICLFSQFFHTNSESSRQMRQQYLEEWFKKVGRFYDPLKFLSMYKQNPLSEEETIKYEIEVSKISSELLSPYNSKWIENALNLLGKMEISEEKMITWVKQIWVLYEKSMKQAILNYQLLNYYERKRLNISSVPKKLNMLEKVSKYGGYSVKLFDQHAFFVNIGRCRLQVNLNKYNILSLSLQKWFEDFKNIKLVQSQGASFLASRGYPISLQKFIDTQEEQFKEMQSILRGVWFRGSAWIVFKEMFLQSTPINPWKQAIEVSSSNKRQAFEQILKNHKNNNTWQLDDSRGNESDHIYQLINQQLQIKKVYDNSLRLISIHTMELDEAESKTPMLNDSMLKSIKQLLKSQLFDVGTKNLNKLINIFSEDLLFQLEPTTNMNSQCIVLPFTCEESVLAIKQIFQRVMAISYMSSGVYMQKQIKLNNSYLSIFNLKQQNKLKVQWKSYEAIRKLQEQVLIKIEKSYLHVVELLTPFLQFQCLLSHNMLQTKEQYSFEQFRKDVMTLKDLRFKLNQLQSRYQAGVFVVNTKKIHKQFKARISQYFALVEKKMKKQLTTDLIQLESDIAETNIKVFQVNTTPQQLCQNEMFLDDYQIHWIKAAKLRCKDVIRKTVEFVIETQPQSTHKGGTFFKTKVSTIYKHMISFDINILQARQQKEKQRNDMESLLHSKKIDILEEMCEMRMEYVESMENYTYIPSKFKQYMIRVTGFRQYIKKMSNDIKQYSKNCDIIFGQNMISIDQLTLELDELVKYNKIYGSYWQFVYDIYQQVKAIHKTQMINLKFSSIERVITQYQEGHLIIQSAFDSKDPYIKYLGNLREEIIPFEKYSKILRQLSEPYLLPQHYNKFELNFANSLMKKILDDWDSLPPKEKDYKLVNNICQIALKESEMRQVLQMARQQVSKQIKITEGRFEIQLTIQSLDKIEQKQYILTQIQASRQLAAKYRDLKQCTSSLKKMIQQLLKLKSVLSQFQIRYYNFSKLFKHKYRHIITELDKFKLAESMWKETTQIIANKPIISQIVTNKYLHSQIIKGNQLIKDLQFQLMNTINNLYQECQLLRMVNKKDFYKYLVEWDYEHLILKCFNNVQEVTITDKQIISLGVPGRNNLVLHHPVGIQILYPEKWIKELQNQIKSTMLTLIKKHLSDQQYKLQQLPQMIESIILMIKYTTLIQPVVESQEGLFKLLTSIQQNQNQVEIMLFIKNRINQIADDKSKWLTFPKYQLNEAIVISYKNQYYEFENVYHDSISMDGQKSIAWMLGCGIVDLDKEENRDELRNKCLIQLAKSHRVIFEGECQNEQLEIVKKMNKALEGLLKQ